MRKFKIVGISLLLVMFLAGCATLGVKPWAERTPKEKALVILEAYNAEFQNTLSMALNPNLTESQKQVVRQKKAILMQLYPLIQLYVGVIEAGGIPSASDEQAILNLIDQLGGKI